MVLMTVVTYNNNVVYTRYFTFHHELALLYDKAKSTFVVLTTIELNTTNPLHTREPYTNH